MSLAERLLRCLGDGRPRSTPTLCQQLQTSPALLAAAREQLIKLGVSFQHAEADKLQLTAPIDWLDPARLQACATALDLDLAIVDICPSTNAALTEDLAERPLPCVLLAEGQSGGRGRRGRGWASPPGAGIYLSLGWRFQCPVAELTALGLIASMAAAKALNACQRSLVQVKWPNDLQVAGRKLGGCLVDLTGPTDGPCEVIIGLGINVNLPSTALIDQPWTDLRRAGFSQTRTELAIALLESLVNNLRVLEANGSAALLSDWHELNALANQPLSVHWDDGRQVLGKAAGIDNNGHLRLRTGSGEISLHSGEVRVRPT